MRSPSTVFSQITGVLYPEEFSRCTRLFPNARPTRGLTEYDPFLAFCFGQLAFRESLRDIVACLQARKHWFHHLGFRRVITRTNLAYANRYRDWRLFQALAQVTPREVPRASFSLADF